MKSIVASNEEGRMSFQRIREGRARYGRDADFTLEGEYAARMRRESKDIERRRRVFEEGIYP